MRFFSAVTDDDWFSYLSAGVAPDEDNLWQPSGNVQFKALQPGEPFLFKLHSPNGQKNGARTIHEMRDRVDHYRESVSTAAVYIRG